MNSRFRPTKQLLATAAGALLYSIPSLVSAQGKEWTGACTQDGVATIQGIECLLGNVLGAAVPVIGMGTFIMLIIGSFQYLTSQGNPKEMAGAKRTISFSVFGLILALSAWAIINVLSGFTGVNLSTFSIKFDQTQP